MEYDRVRDFLILHYHATTRDDSDFWNHVRTMQVPDSLAGKLELWRRAGRIEKYSDGLFYDASWIAVYLGQGITPRQAPPLAGMRAGVPVAERLGQIRQAMAEAVAAMASHGEFIARHCAAPGAGAGTGAAA